MTPPIVLDLFAGAGGAAMGYHRAGFTVVGVDLEPHPDYPFEFHLGDALDALREVIESGGYFRGHRVILIHASPPCQRYSTATANKDRHPDLVPPVRELLIATGLPYIIENVPQAPLIDPVRLCGSSFGLRVRRHRAFESNLALTVPPCDHKTQGTPVGVYGDHFDTREFLRPDGTRRGGKARSLEDGRDAMGIDWMTWEDLKESIPPAYTEHLGRQAYALIVDDLDYFAPAPAPVEAATATERLRAYLDGDAEHLRHADLAQAIDALEALARVRDLVTT